MDVASRERSESDVLLDKLNSTRLDSMQKPLVSQIESGFRALQEDLDDSKERLRIATGERMGMTRSGVHCDTLLRAARNARTCCCGYEDAVVRSGCAIRPC